MLYGAIEAGGTKMVLCIGDENCNILEQISLPTLTPAETMPLMIDFFKGKGIKALGVGCFGPLDLNPDSPTYGSITSTPKLPWRDYPLITELEKALGVKCVLDTDVNAAALCEAKMGAAKGLKNCVYITVGTGIGAGVYCEGKLVHGGLHPEWGHMPLQKHPSDPMEKGNCPYHEACLEGLAAGPSLEKRWGVKGAELSERKEVWELEAYYLGQAIVNYIMVLSPERIILGGGVSHQEQLLPLVRAEVKRQLAGYIKGKGIEDLDSYIVPISLNDNQGAMGCIKLAVEAENN